MKIRSAVIDDLDAIFEIESESFRPEVASSKRSLRRSILSDHQKVFVIERETIDGCAILYVYKKSIRLFSIAVSKNAQNRGYGRALLQYCESFARNENKDLLSLEADAQNVQLINWYSSNGFTISNYIEDYYGKELPAYLMVKKLTAPSLVREKVKNIIVTDVSFDYIKMANAQVVPAKDYITQDQYQNDKNLRVFNFCSNYTYQSVGYYVSLLAEARGHKVLPSVSTMQDIFSKSLARVFGQELKDQHFSDFDQEQKNKVVYQVILGCESTGRSTKLSKCLYKLFDAPFVEYTFIKSDTWLLEKVRLMTIDEVRENEKIPFDNIVAFSLTKKVYSKRQLTNYQYSLAILVNPDEPHPPSDKTALEKFRLTGLANGFYVEFITKDDSHRINEFDALFIRKTTAVNDHTYQIARHAQAEGLVVIDDPWSILKCSNKFYLYERMKKTKVKMPSTRIISSCDFGQTDLLTSLKFPLVVKQPDGAFSLGVFKVENETELIDTCVELLKSSEFVIIQEFVESEFDWRIGVMNNEVLFACKYYMAEGHWQIYNWRGQEDKISGNSETCNIDEVPDIVLETALEATLAIGSGLYGVDLKTVNNECYLIEVNDNPNIDSGIEDAILQDVLYDRIIRNIRSMVINKQSKSSKICM